MQPQVNTATPSQPLQHASSGSPIEAPVRLGEPSTLTSVYAEVRANHFRRSFELSSDLDTAKIEAGLRDGVLTLRIPKAEQAKPRRIDVRVE